ncbi:MAG: 4Fe-4S binding protein [Thermodesulfobacteriota bacterium]|jgi:heterodisulfide reductase subunit A
MRTEKVPSSGPSCAVIVEERCTGCGTCISICSYGAIGLRETARGGKAAVDLTLCRGDGLCGSFCATGAIEFQESSRRDIFQQIDDAVARA